VSATQLLAQSIASLAIPRKSSDNFLYGNSPLGEAQRYMKVAEPATISKSVSVGTETSTPKSVSSGTQTFVPKSVSSGTQTSVPKSVSVGTQTSMPKSVSVGTETSTPKSFSSGTQTFVPRVTETTTPAMAKPAKYSRQQIQPMEARPGLTLIEPIGRYGEQTRYFSTVGTKSSVATPIAGVSSKPAKERKSYESMTDAVSAPAGQISPPLTSQYFTGTVLERTPMTVPLMRNISDDKFFKELTTRQRYANESITNASNTTLPSPMESPLTQSGLGRKLVIGSRNRLADYVDEATFTTAGRPRNEIKYN
jgi:hypothetical protein